MKIEDLRSIEIIDSEMEQALFEEQEAKNAWEVKSDQLKILIAEKRRAESTKEKKIFVGMKAVREHVRYVCELYRRVTKHVHGASYWKIVHFMMHTGLFYKDKAGGEEFSHHTLYSYVKRYMSEDWI